MSVVQIENMEPILKHKQPSAKKHSIEMAFSRSPAKLSIISWNLDGLDEHNLVERTTAVVSLLLKRNYTVIMLQELIAPTYQYIVAQLKSKYFPVAGNGPQQGYFTATFLRTNCANYVDHQIVKFPGTAMDRNLLITRCQVDQTKFVICNTHLESTAAFASERVNQLKICFERCVSFPPEWNVIFGGDLNARDSELQGRVPVNMCDVWMKCGANEYAKHTWDLKLNTNKQMPSKVQPRCRFDRLFFRESIPASVTPEFFGLTGLDVVNGTDSFPSDHWAIVAFFQMK